MPNLLGSVFMEGIKHSYAKNKGYPQNSGGYFLKVDGTTYSFKELVKEFYNEYGTPNGDREFYWI